MKKRISRYSMFMIAVAFTLSVCEVLFLSQTVVVYAKKRNMDEDVFRKYEAKLKLDKDEEESMGFDADGNFIMVTRDRGATSNTVYRTLGWTIKRYDAPLTENESVRIKLVSSGKGKADPNDPNYEYHYFKCSKELIFEKIEASSEEWLHELYTEGGYVYLDGVMTISENGAVQGSMDEDGSLHGEVYLTYAGISTARSWLDPYALKTHFDKKLYFPKNEKMLYGTYEVHYMELTEGAQENAISLKELGYDVDSTKLGKEDMTIVAEDLENYGLEFVNAIILSKEYNKKAEQKYKKRKIYVDNRKLSYKYVKVYYYYQRIEQVELKRQQYGIDLIKENKLSISSEDKNNPKFDVTLGIPTSEKLRIDGTVQKYAYKLTYEEHKGSKMIPVPVKVTYTVLVSTQAGYYSYNVQKTKIYYVKRDYTYYTISKLQLMYADHVIVENYSLPGEKMILNELYKPKLLFKQEKEDYLTLPEASVSLYGGLIDSPILTETDFMRAAENACGEIVVRNDTLQIDEDVILSEGPFQCMADGLTKPQGSRELSIEEGDIEISNEKRNGVWNSKAEVIYIDNESGAQTNSPIKKVNDVVIHTPTICIAGTSDEKEYNQQIVPTSYHSLILGRDFRVSIRTEGEHLEIPGYNYRDYSRYIQYSQVRFPFPVYDKEQYIQEHTWINLEVSGVATKQLYLPIGVEEGDYVIEFRTMAKNYDSIEGGDSRAEQIANLTRENYTAVDEIQVTVIGRMYGLELTEIVDRPRWTSVFFNADGTRTGKTYRIGNHNCNGEQMDIDEASVFPVLSGSHPFNSKTGPVRLGYRVKFRLKTIGSLYNNLDKILLKPSFYHIDSNGKRTHVDLYKMENLKKIDELIVLNADNRTYKRVDEKNVADIVRQKNSLQIWEGEYQLSPDVAVVPLGTDLVEYSKEKGGRLQKKDAIFLKSGYLIVQFQVRSVAAGKKHLDYINEENSRNGYCNMWNKEGFFYNRVDSNGVVWNFSDGDTLVFDRNRTMYDDYQTVGTH